MNVIEATKKIKKVSFVHVGQNCWHGTLRNNSENMEK